MYKQQIQMEGTHKIITCKLQIQMKGINKIIMPNQYCWASVWWCFHKMLKWSTNAHNSKLKLIFLNTKWKVALIIFPKL